MWPVLKIDGGKFLEPPVTGMSDPGEIAKFADTFYKPGRAYRVMFGGAPAASAVITGDGRNSECGKSFGNMTVTMTSAFNRQLMVIATNDATLGSRVSARRAPTADERTQALTLAKDTYKANGVSADLVSTVEVVNLTAIDVDGKGKPTLVGTFVVKKKTGVQTRDVLFVIAEPSDTGFRAAVAHYNHISADKIMGGADIENVGVDVQNEKLIDHLDLDKDGVSEILAEARGYEGDTYILYKRTSGRWVEAFKGYNYRCAF